MSAEMLWDVPDLDLGPGRTAIYIRDGERNIGLIVSHENEIKRRCSLAIAFAGSENSWGKYRREFWTIERETPLTLSPSILCGRCGDHGYIREGKWIAA